jgi:hypothetical protein
LESLVTLSSRLGAFVPQNSAYLKSSALHDLSKVQYRSVLVARAYYYQIFSEFFPASGADELQLRAVLTNILLSTSQYVATPGCMCQQMLLRSIRSIRTDLAPFARSLLRSMESVPLPFFSFSTFPAIFSYFTTSENVESASKFLITLLSFDQAPERLVRPLFRSFLFSAYAFLDALWTKFHKEVCTKQQINEVIAMTGLCNSIEACSPLLSFGAFRVIQGILGRFPVLCCGEVLTFLRVSFKLWHEHSADGMSFGCSPSFLEFFAGSEDFCVGNSITIVATILKSKRRVNVCSAFGRVPHCSAEATVFSFQDFPVFRKAFDNTEPRIPFFQAIDVEGPMPKLSPSFIEDFPLSESNNARPPPIIAIPDIPETTLTVHPIYERAISQNVRIRSAVFDEYARKKLILSSRTKMREFEEFLELRLAAKAATGFLKSLVRQRNLCFDRYCRKWFESVAVHSVSIERLTDQVLRRCSDWQSVFTPFLVEQLNAAKVDSPATAAITCFEVLKDAHVQPSWDEMLNFGGIRRVTQLVPKATRRWLGRYGDVFLMLSHLFWKNRKVRKHFAALHDAAKHMRFLAVNSQVPGLLHIFLFFDELFKHESVRENIGAKLAADWDCFLGVIRDIIGEDRLIATHMPR